MAVARQNRRNRLRLGQDNNALTWLIVINAVVFVLINFIKVIYQLSYDDNKIALAFFDKQVLDWFTLTADTAKLASRPWTILLYMVTHESLWHLISNLLWLWAFGYILQDLTGNSKLIPVYIYGGLTGALFFLLTNILFPQLNAPGEVIIPLSGASASVMAVAIATTALSPDYRIFPMINGGIPLWVLTLVFVAIDFATIGSSSEGYAAAHLGAAAIGFLFIKQLRRGYDWSEWMINLVNRVNNFFSPGQKNEKLSAKQQYYYKATRKPFEKTPHVTQQKLDEILDKINQKGYHLLTDEEREFLKKASQEDF